MAIFQRKEGGHWHVEYVLRGERIRFSTNTNDKRTAENLERADKTKRLNGEAGVFDKKPVPTLSAFLAGRFADFVAADHIPETQRVYKNSARYLNDYGLGKLRLNEITNEQVASYMADMRRADYSAVSINTGIALLRKVLTQAVEWGVIPSKPALKSAKGENRRTRVLTEEEIDRYLAACSAHWFLMALAMIEAGLRPSEARGLRWENINLDARLLRITHGKSKNAKRQLPIRERFLNALRAHWDAQGKPETGWVFASPRRPGKPMIRSEYRHAQALQKSGVAPFVPYTARHTCLTQLATNKPNAPGCDPFTLMKIAGHSNIAMTERYIHPQEEAISAAFARQDAKRPHKIPHIVKRGGGRAA